MKKILVVPDLKNIIEEEESIWKRAEYRVLTAASGEEALKIHKVEKLDMVIVNLNMPGMDGDKLCSRIKKDKDLKDAFVILISPDAKSDIKRCLKSRADFHITKPVDTNLLLEKVREILNIRSRAFARIPLEMTVVGSSGKTFFCYARDLSTSGILIETDKILHKKDSVSCLFHLSDSIEIVVDGVIVRVKVKLNDIYQYGIRFSHLPEIARAEIERFVRMQA